MQLIHKEVITQSNTHPSTEEAKNLSILLLTEELKQAGIKDADG